MAVVYKGMEGKIWGLKPERRQVADKIDIIIVCRISVGVDEPGGITGKLIIKMLQVMRDTDQDVPEQQQILIGKTRISIKIMLG